MDSSENDKTTITPMNYSNSEEAKVSGSTGEKYEISTEESSRSKESDTEKQKNLKIPSLSTRSKNYLKRNNNTTFPVEPKLNVPIIPPIRSRRTKNKESMEEKIEAPKKKNSAPIRSLPLKRKLSNMKRDITPILYHGEKIDKNTLIPKELNSSEETIQEDITEEKIDRKESPKKIEEDRHTEINDKANESKESDQVDEEETYYASPLLHKEDIVQPTSEKKKARPTVYRPIGETPLVPDYESLTKIEQAHHRASFKSRYGILRSAWPTYHIKDPSPETPLAEIHAEYATYVKHIHITKQVNQYKTYLVVLWLLIEVFCKKIDLVDIEGYTMSQFKAMNDYEKLLIELGEINNKNTIITANGNTDNQWPVEVQICYMALFNAICFIGVKMLSNYLGENVAKDIISSLSSLFANAPPPQNEERTVYVNEDGVPIAQRDSNGIPLGGMPIPKNDSQDITSNINIPSLLATLGSSYIRSTNNTKPTEPKATDNAKRFQPMYTE
jgi:hypothetical protein